MVTLSDLVRTKLATVAETAAPKPAITNPFEAVELDWATNGIVLRIKFKIPGRSVEKNREAYSVLRNALKAIAAKLKFKATNGPNSVTVDMEIPKAKQSNAVAEVKPWAKATFDKIEKSLKAMKPGDVSPITKGSPKAEKAPKPVTAKDILQEMKNGYGVGGLGITDKEAIQILVKHFSRRK